MSIQAHTRRNKGFTLVELSIVLLVIGLIVAAITVGKTMVRQSQIMSVITDVQNYTAAAKNFQQKYSMLPGDFNGAQALWGVNPNCSTFAAGTGTQTCNGDGNGQVGNDVTGTPAQDIESLWFWQHLANAQMIAGSYTGSSSSSTGRYSIPGSNVPASKVQGAGYSFIFVGVQPTDGAAPLGDWFAANYGHVIEFGAQDKTYNFETWPPILTAAEAASIDSKIDDGLPGTGNVMTQNMYALPYCDNSWSHTAAIYTVNTTGANSSQAVCSLIFITGM